MSKRVSAVGLLAKRFLLSKASDGFISFIAWVSVLGVALGVLALTVVTSVINGFEGELSNVVTGMNGDVVLYSRGEAISDPELIEKKIRKVVPETRAVTWSFVTEMMAAGPNGVAGAVMEGVDLESASRVTVVPRRVVAGRLPMQENEVAIGTALAERIGAEAGSEIRIIIPFAGESTGQGGEAAPKAVKMNVVGLIRVGMYEYDSKFIFGTLDGIRKLLNQPGKVTNFKLKLAEGADARQASNRLSDSFGYPFRAKDWAQMNKNLFFAIKLEKAVISIILTVIILVAAFNVVSTLMMMIHDKTKEIAILKTMGFRPAQGFQLFCLVGGGMGLVGTAVGVGVGLLINWILGQTRLIQLPADIYYIGFLPVVMRWPEIALIAVLGLLIALLASVYPAWKVAKRSPLDGLRYE